MKQVPEPDCRQLILYFQVHQPRRLKPFSFFDIGSGREYFDDAGNREIMRRVSRTCYLPTNLLLLSLIRSYPNLRVAFSVSGVALEEMERFAPAVIESFKMLAATGNVEFLSETYYHSLASLISPGEFEFQVEKHGRKIKELFGMRPTVFRNTELIYSDEIGRMISNMGFKGVIADGHETLLGNKSAHHLYQHPNTDLNIILRDYSLSDDIAFRFSQRDWMHWPLTPKKFMRWLEAIPNNENVVTISLDYETFGEHQKSETGIFRFLAGFMKEMAASHHYRMVTPSEAIEQVKPVDTLSISRLSSWADQERDLSAWLGNEMQHDAFQALQRLENNVKATGKRRFTETWRHLQTSDHLYYMSTKTGADGKVHNYFSPYASPYDAFMNYMNLLNDFSIRLERSVPVPSATRHQAIPVS
jgi:alpha-amylase